MLDIQSFKELIKSGSLFAIDLIVTNDNDEVLLGLRKNSPAKNYFFVPGGRTFKDENLHNALERISSAEIGIKLSVADITPIGIYEHPYNENFFEEPGFSTHYIVLACRVNRKISPDNLPNTQHSDFIFLNNEALLSSNLVHQYTKNYFLDSPGNIFLKF